MHRHLLLLGLGATAFVAGCLLMPPSSKLPRPVAIALDDPARDSHSFTLFSLEPAPIGTAENKVVPGAKMFHGHTVLGEINVTDPVTRRKLVAAFKSGVSDHDGSVAACFMPHHGIRVRRDDTTIDLVICFMCAQVKVYINGKESETILISTSPRATFNDILDRHHIPVSDKAR